MTYPIHISDNVRRHLQQDPKPLFQLYLSWACPFCHRVLLAIAFNGLEKWFDITWTEDVKPEEGWIIRPENEPLWRADSVKEIYRLASDGQQQGSSVPLLLEIESKRLLSDSSADMVRLIGSGFNGVLPVQSLLAGSSENEMDAVNNDLHERLNRAVYRVLSAENQQDYERQVNAVFTCLDEWEARLSRQTYALGEAVSEADAFLLPTLLRFDAVYNRLFYCSKKRIADYPHLSRYTQAMLSQPAVAATFSLEKSMVHYYLSAIHLNGKPKRLNPLGVVPLLD